MTATTTLTDQLAPLAARLADIQARKADLENTEKALKNAIATLVDKQPGTYSAGPVKVTVTVAHRLDTKTITAKYPAEAHPELYEQAISIPAVRQHFAPADLEAFEIPSAPMVKLT